MFFRLFLFVGTPTLLKRVSLGEARPLGFHIAFFRSLWSIPFHPVFPIPGVSSGTPRMLPGYLNQTHLEQTF